MFSLGDGTRFWLYSKPTDMRKDFNMQGGIVNNAMGQNLYSGDCTSVIFIKQGCHCRKMATRWTTFAKNKIMEQSRDIYFFPVARFIIANKTASASAIQRHFGIGYYRTAGIISELEEAGLVGPQEGKKSRKVLFDNMLDFVRSIPRREEEIKEHEWILHLDYFCPAQIYYYFHDAEGRRWCIYLRWRHSDPWTAELVQCDDAWEFLTDGDWMNLLEETNHTPGTVTGYYREDEYELLMEEALRKVRMIFKDQAI